MTALVLVLALFAGEIEVRLVPGYGGRARGGRLNPVSVRLANSGPDIQALLVVLCGNYPVRCRVELPRGSKKLFRLGGRFGPGRAQAFLLREGEELERRSVPVMAVEEEEPFCAWVGRTGAGLSAVRSARGRWAVVRPEELPEHPVLYDALDALVVACDEGDLDERQREALRAWVECGGLVAHEGPRPRFLEGCGGVVPLDVFRQPKRRAKEEEPFEEATQALATIMEVRYPSVGWLAGVLFLMAFVLTPAEYYLLKKWKKLHLSWWIFGGEIAAFCAGTYLWTWGILGSTMSFAEIAVADPLPSGRERVRGVASAFVPAATRVEFSCRGVVWPLAAEGQRGRFAPGTEEGTFFEDERCRLRLRATQWSQVAARFDLLRRAPPAPKIEVTASRGRLNWGRVEVPQGSLVWALSRGRLFPWPGRAGAPLPGQGDDYETCARFANRLVLVRKMFPPRFDPGKDTVVLVVRKEAPVCGVTPAPQKAKAFVVRRYVVKGK